MKKYTFITVLSVFLILAISIAGAILYGNEAVPFWFVIIGILAVVNFGFWVALNVSELMD